VQPRRAAATGAFVRAIAADPLRGWRVFARVAARQKDRERDMKRLLAAAGLCLGLMVSAAAPAQELKIAVGAEPTSIDPLFHNLNPNLAIARHIFDQLAAQDEKQRLQPGLALSWKPLDDTTWEFKLRPGVKFHDGTPLTPEDIIFSIDRADKVPNSPSALSIYTSR